MASKSPVKLSVKNNMFYLEEGMLELYIYQDYMEKNSAKIVGTKVESLGLLPMALFKDIKATKPTWQGTLMIPTTTTFYPSSTDTDQRLKLYPDSDEKEYTVIRFEKGDRFTSPDIIQNLDNVVLFTEMILNGRLDCNIPYDQLSTAWVKNMLLNKVSLNVPITNIESIVANLCRYKDDLTKPFSWVYGKNPDKVSQVAYRFVNVREICAADSVFGALSFEDMNYMLDSSLNMTSEGREQRISPVEKVIKL